MTNPTPPYQPENVDVAGENDSSAKTDDSMVTTAMYNSSFKQDVNSSMDTQVIPLYNSSQPESASTTEDVTSPTESIPSTESYPYSDVPAATPDPVAQSVYSSIYATHAEETASPFKPTETMSDFEPTPTTHANTLYTPMTEAAQPAPAEVAATPEPTPTLSPEDAHLLTTGQRLRQLREQKHLTIQNVADKLYLDHSVIQALENDSYEALPPPIFVRGYLRGYAKILEVPAATLIEKYDTFVGHKSPPPITPQSKPKKQATTDDLWVKFITYTIFVILMILMVLWGVNHYGLLNSTQETNNDSNTPTGENLELHPGGVGMEGDYVPPSEGDDDKPIVGQPVTPPPPPVPVAPPPPPVDLRVLNIHYQKNGSWTRVTDSKGVKVYEGTPKSGEVINVKGEPPFKVRFGAGNAGIEIEYKGQKAAAETYPKSGKNITVGEAIPASPPSPTPAAR